MLLCLIFVHFYSYEERKKKKKSKQILSKGFEQRIHNTSQSNTIDSAKALSFVTIVDSIVWMWSETFYNSQ